MKFLRFYFILLSMLGVSMEAHANSASASTSEVWILVGLGTTSEDKGFQINNVNTHCAEGCTKYGEEEKPAQSCSNSPQTTECSNGPAAPKASGMQQANCCCHCTGG